MMALLFSFAAMLMVWDEGKKKNWKHGEMSEVEERKRGRVLCIIPYICLCAFFYLLRVCIIRERGGPGNSRGYY